MIQQPTADLEGRHIASFTNSEMIILNLQELQDMGTFSIQIALLEQPQPRIYAYQHGETQNCFLLTVPLTFYHSTKNKSKTFIQLLCLCSKSITVPVDGEYLQEVQDLLQTFCLKWKQKRGNSMVKLYIETECMSSYLDLVTFQAIQFKGKTCKELISMKKHNAYEYCINAFRQELLPDIYQNEQDSVAEALDCCMSELKALYISLECNGRFEVIYQVMSPQSCNLNQLLAEIQMMVVSRQITTVGDQQCEELINEELLGIVNRELNSQEKELRRMKPPEQQVFFIKILHNLLQTIRQYNFQINDQKYLFLNSKILEKTYQIQSKYTQSLQEQKNQLISTLTLQEQEMKKLKVQLQTAKQTISKKQNLLPKITQKEQDGSTTKRIHAQSNQNKSKPTLTIKDLKEPLQVIMPNTSIDKLHKTGLAKVKEKLREGLNKQENKVKQNVGKYMRKV